jgi:signal transduction histidine kinase
MAVTPTQAVGNNHIGEALGASGCPARLSAVLLISAAATHRRPAFSGHGGGTFYRHLSEPGRRPVRRSPDAESPTEQVERVAIDVVTVARAAVLVVVVVATVVSWSHITRPVLEVLFLAALAGETVALILLCRRWGRMPVALALVDVGVVAAAMLVAPALVARSGHSSWANNLHWFALAGPSVTVAVMPGRLLRVLAIVSPLAVAHTAAAVVHDHTVPANVAFDNVNYLTNAALAGILTRLLRASARRQEESQALALERATALARARERARQARLLHDRVLQTIEMVARGTEVDDEVRRHLGAEASWLRRMLHEEAAGHANDALAVVHATAERQMRWGLDVSVQDAGARRASPELRALSAPRAEALAGALGEVLTNVHKHAGDGAATIRVQVDEGRVRVIVRDRGVGFDPAVIGRGGGLGIEQSIVGRLGEVGGSASLRSSVGEGTRWELIVPCTGGDRPVRRRGSTTVSVPGVSGGGSAS